MQRRVRACVTTAARYAVVTRASAIAAAGYRALGGQQRAAGGGEAHRAARKMALGSLVAGESTALVGDASGIRGRRRGWGSVRWCSASCVLAWRRSRGRRSERTRRKGLEVAAAASTTAARPWWHSVAVGNEGARCGGSGGGAQGPRREWGGEWEEEPRRRGVATLSPRLIAGEGGSVGTRPVPTRVGGTGAGDAVRELGRRGRPGWLRARGVGRWPCGWVGLPGPGGFPPFFVFL